MKISQKESVSKFFSYLIVGGGATAVEWVFYRIFSSALEIQYLVATILAILISTFSNWALGRILTFRKAEHKNIFKEIIQIYAVSVVGLIMNVLLMWLFHGQLGISDMIAKILATGIVFIYNYLSRILYVYKS